MPDAALDSRQVSWWSVHTFVQAALNSAEVASFPMAGTPAWCTLADGDPRKVAALFDAAQHWALRVETFQQERAEASRAVSKAADWGSLARGILTRESFYNERPWLKRRREVAS